MIKIDLSPDKKKLKQFGWFGLFGFFLIGIVLNIKFGIHFNDHIFLYLIWPLTIMSPILALVYPKALLPIYVILSLIAIPIGFVLSNLILFIIFFFLITPLSLYFKIRKRDELRIRQKYSQSKSNWTRFINPADVQSYFHQY